MGIFDKFRKKDYDDYDDEDEEFEEDEENEASVNLEGNLDLKVVCPKTLEQLLVAVDYLSAGSTVLLNLEGVEKTLYKRMIDFISGAAYAMKISIKKATGNSYCIAPNDVNVSGETFENSNDDVDEFFDV